MWPEDQQRGFFIVFRTIALSTTAFVAVSTAAHATCEDDASAPVGAPVITCDDSPAQQSTAVSDARDNLTVNVLGSAIVSDPAADVFDLGGNGVRLDNAGSILGGDGDTEARGINAEGLGVEVDNTGSIVATDDAIRADGGNVTVRNAAGATIESLKEKAIRARGADTKIENAGTIVSADEAVEGRDAFAMTNSGTVTSTGDDAVQFGDGTLTNSGVITGGDDGVDVDSGRIVNSGVITTTDIGAGAAIDVDPDAESGDPAGTLVIDNSGAIRAALAILFDEESTAEQQIFNTGIIEGTAGTAIRFAPGQGASLLSLSGGSQIIGDVIFGDNSDTVAVEDLTSGVLINSMFDGNGGSDLADFADYELGDLTSVAYLDAATVLLGLQAGNGDSLTGTFSDFESFRFGGIDYAFEDLGDLVTRPIPLPAGLPLLATALAGTVLLRRRR